MNYAQTYLMANMSSFPAELLPVIQRELENLDEQGVNALMMTEIKNPTTALILAIFTGPLGIDRFYIGNKELGIAKLALTVVGFLTLIFIIGIFLLIASGIWALVDIFLIMGACKQANFDRFMQQINQVKMFKQATQTKAEPSQATVETAPVSETVVMASEVAKVTDVAEEVVVETEEIVATEEVVAVEAEETVVNEEVVETEDAPVSGSEAE
ncbi:TPA: TM2 domain-containing protein [Streptococcus suis]|nr:TM2 domain-containing protein [Streptococcus suis]HEL2384508.1 TM2 domain-containing protein [Streptococcus suis]HEM2548307.1 TM2 domain-containing protein [Streptococcus suis]